MRCVELKEDPLERRHRPSAGHPGGLKKFFRIIQRNPKESIDGRE